MGTPYPGEVRGPWDDFQPRQNRGGVVTRPGPQPAPQTPAQQALDRARLEEAERKKKQAEATGGIDSSVEQARAAGFYSRAQRADQNYGAMGVGPRSLPGQFMQDNFPSVDNALFIDDKTQQAKVWQNDFIAAALRYESGAAIPIPELEEARRRYFPMPGDSEETMRAKAEARQNTIESLRLGGGAASTLVRKDDGSTDFALQQPGKAAPDEEVRFKDEREAPRGKRFTAAQEAEVADAIRSGDVGQAVMLIGRYNGGKPVDRASIQAVADAVAKDPRTPISFNYYNADQEAQNAYERERYGEYLPEAMADRAKPGGGVDSAVRQAANAPTVGLADVASAGVNTIFGGGKGDGLGERFRDNLRRERARTEADFRVNPAQAWTGSIAGSLAIPTRFASVSASAREGALARGATMRDALSVGRRAGTLRLGAEGAAYGGVRGLVDNIESPNRFAYGLAGAATGGIGGLGVGSVFSRLGTRGIPGDESALSVARAADAEGIPVSRPIIDPSRRNAAAYLEASVGGSPIRSGLERTGEALEARVGALGGEGRALDETGMGSVIQGAGRRFINQSGQRARLLYDQATQMAGNAAVRGENAVKALDDQIADLSRNANANAPLIRYLEEIKADFVDTAGNLITKDVGAIRDLRTSLRGQISNRNLTATDAERRISQVLDAASLDVQRDLGRAAPEATEAFARADQFYRERQSEINNVIQRVLGRSRRADDQISPERAWQNVRAMAGPNGDSRSLARLWNRLDDQEAADAAATIAANMGRRSADEPFSPAQFVNSVRGLSKEARETLFGPRGAQSVENLRRVSEAFRDTMSRLNNSRSGQIQQYGQFFRNFVPGTLFGIGGGALVGGAPGAAVGGAVMAGTGVLARNVSARLLMSPAYSRWLVRAAMADNPRKMTAAIRALATAATRDPAVTQEMLGIQEELRRALENPEETYPVTVSAGRR